ncbi:MAG: hypothetical protein M1819_004837 [Sarea resinae]|nr:MAG: hypothetical protein M1819_004837 [Sarea resinae]
MPNSHNGETAAAPSSQGEMQRKPRSRRPLPLPPFLDPERIEAKQRHRRPKDGSEKPRTPFQDRLANNPYAQALATPVRFCPVTQVRLPKYFLIPFTVKPHPSTGAHWLLPHGLSEEEEAAKKAGAEAKARRKKAKHISISTLNPDIPSSNATANDPTTTTSPLPPSTPALHQDQQPMAYILSSPGVLHNITLDKHNRAAGRIVPTRLRTHIRPSTLVYRDDMPAFVAELLRKKVVAKLAYLARRRGGYLTVVRSSSTHGDEEEEGEGEERWSEVRRHRQLGAVLWLGNPPSSPSASPVPTPTHPSSPPPFSTISYLRRSSSPDVHLPVYNLLALLGPSHLSQIRASSPELSDAHTVVLRAKKATLETRMLLWKLVGYLSAGSGRDSMDDEGEGEDERRG